MGKKSRRLFFRICRKCDARYTPPTKQSTLCKDCLKEVRRQNVIKLFKARGIKSEIFSN